MNIVIKKVIFENFMSYEKGEYDFRNGIDLITGQNGKGKSSITEAVFYALFGKPYRKIKTSALINKIKNSKMLVTLYMGIDGVEYKIVRGIKPSIFLIHRADKDAEYALIQEQASVKDYQKTLEEEILKINETVFRQLLSISSNLSSSKPFMELNAKEKEELFQIITDTSIFSDIKEILNKRTKDRKSLLRDLDFKKSILEASLESERITVGQHEKRNTDFLEHHEDNIKVFTNSILKTEETIDRYLQAIEKLKILKSEYSELNASIDDLKNESSVIVTKINEHKSKIRYIDAAIAGAIACTECNTLNYLVEVDTSKKDWLVQELETLSSDYSALILEINEAQTKSDNIKEKLLNGKRIKQNLEEQHANLEYYKGKLNELHQIKPVEIDYTILHNKEAEFKEVLNELSYVQEALLSLELLDNVVGNNNLKGQILKTQIPLLNKEINYFLELFSLLEYNFIIDENFQERIISRDQDSEFQSLSNGQKARISFSIIFAFLKLIEERNGIKVNLLVLDEILDSSVDSQGREELLNILKSEFSLTKNIMIISHNDQIKEKVELFDRIISVEKEIFSKIIEE